MSKDYTFIDLFAGIGGIRIAFERNKMKCVFSSEWDKFAQQTYNANFGIIPSGDINTINYDDIPEHDILTAGFPCQPFSMVGKREGFSHATQGNLFFNILDILKIKKPKAFLLENVVGLKTIDGGKTFELIKKLLQKEGYKIKILEENSKNYGLPQIRKRLYFIGFKNNYNLDFVYKKPIIKDVFINEFLEDNKEGYEISDKTINNYLFKKNDGNPQIVSRKTKIQVKTMVASYHKIQRLTGTFVNDNGRIRLLSENEVKAIMGFPKNYIFPVSRTQMYRQLGNSVAIPVVQSIAKQMKEFLIMSEKNKKNEINSFNKITQSELIFEYFKDRPNKEIEHPEIVDYVVNKYKQLTGKIMRDPDRAIRKLYSEGKLIKIKKGVYMYDPEYKGFNKNKNLFTSKQKKEILEKGEYRCSICGLGKENGEELHVDHIIPLDKGGQNIIENGQILCSKHNFLKKNFNQTETGKRFFLNLLSLLENQDNEKNLLNFVKDVLEIYEKYNINGHIIVDDKGKLLSKLNKT